jgi:hypothetical protein
MNRGETRVDDKRYCFDRDVAQDRAWADWKRELAFAKQFCGIAIMRWLFSRSSDYFEACDE